ncbi:MAG: hypothetical protein A2831_00155 [Candidatus Yanofskybacteria bacterium RIFCSPHIGHO2_01_FULL_44_17]|uniref:Uncharacterized protein n=1 Tax=Candidatus Yanofskybacteria bacterium RIFCSPHIGHO2_01_FULL_44_17 TaxID=1802668 RepID=A0A1F8ESX2_9BACT|nr:MAG: hypothetical protein A2831_00155 [Candidatus Yanofskybacteria bacterium RIFCSPHIGHO2_01_FULL_44_17]
MRLTIIIVLGLLAPVGICLGQNQDQGAGESETQKRFCRYSFYPEGGAPSFKPALEWGLAHFEELEEILNNSQLAYCWYDAAMVVGASGTMRAVRLLEKFFSEGEGPLTESEFDGKFGAMLGLGWAANRFGLPTDAASFEATRYLIFLSRGNSPVGWVTPYPHVETWVHITRTAFRALGLTGKSSARASISNNPVCKLVNFKANCESGLDLIKRTQKEGLDKIYPQ